MRYLYTWILFSALSCLNTSPAENNPLQSETVKLNNLPHPGFNISPLHQDDFFLGQAFFRSPWVSAPASTTARDGLGPLFNAKSCQSCHIRNARGQISTKETENLTTVIRISVAGASSQNNIQMNTLGSLADPVYGQQLQTQSLSLLAPEAKITFSQIEIKGKFADGESYTLIKPKLEIAKWNYGHPKNALMMSVRTPPALIGMGLLDAISASDIIANADPDDFDHNGISGRSNQVWDIKKQQTVAGRFGWKAGQPTLAQQVAAAFNQDIGITSTFFPRQNCTQTQHQCLQRPDGGTPEITESILQKVVKYTALLPAPDKQKISDHQVQTGAKLFHLLDCHLCHQPQFKTGPHPIQELSAQVIYPYSDLLLHDMGEGLADHRPEFTATGQEWRTAPLWGMGLIKPINGQHRLLHDGRARNLKEAILWHGGEAESAQQQFLNLNKKQREALLVFLQSL